MSLPRHPVVIEHPDYPALKWHPETGAAREFTAPHDVPEGWLNHHPNSAKQAAKPAKPAGNQNQLPLTKAQIVDALKAGNIPFQPNQGAAALYAVLEAALRAHLTENKIDTPEGADVPALLALANSKSE